MNRRALLKGLGAAAAILVFELKPPRLDFADHVFEVNPAYHRRNMVGQLWQSRLIADQALLNQWFNEAVDRIVMKGEFAGTIIPWERTNDD
jgi:hypothetical protein